jgi:uncharacterized protein YjiS (DUF1127 family)
MRYYAITLAENMGAAHSVSLLARLLRNWRSRRRLARLRDLDDHLLADIGVRREEVDRALALPLTVNSAEALQHSARRRRLEEARRRPGWGAY